jgi:hypothetical protein
LLDIKSGVKEELKINTNAKIVIPIENASINTVAVRLNEDGTKELIRKSIVNAKTNEICFYADFGTFEIIDNYKKFDDIKETEWYSDAISFVTSREIFSGTAENIFSPNEVMSRAMISQVLYNLENKPECIEKSNFVDVSSKDWYANAVNWAVSNEIISGYGNGKYAPNDNLTREQLIVMLWKYSGKPESMHKLEHFNDASKISDYAIKALQWANEKGIINGNDKGLLEPKDKATRAQVAQIFKKLFEL